MDLIIQANILKHILRLSDRSKSIEPATPYIMHKPPFNENIPLGQPFARSAPEEQGVSSGYITDYLNELRSDKKLDLHSIMIMKNGRVIAEGNFGAYRKDVWHVTHSMSKSVTGMAIGMLISEGRLSVDDKIVKIFEKRINPLSLIAHKNLTVRHLLTMTSGISFSEAGAIVETDWVKAYLESSEKTEPGKEFNYNSMNSYMLSAIVREITGTGLMEYLTDRLWKPLEITQVYWQRCPKGTEAGGWGLYIRPEDALKLGQLYLQKGVWKGKRILPAKWIEESTKTSVITPAVNGDYNYGFQLWVGRNNNTFLFNGMFGQNLLVFPDSQTVIMITAGNDEIFQQSSFFKLTNKYFCKNYASENPLPSNPAAKKALVTTENSLYKKPPLTGLKALISKYRKPSLPKQCGLYGGRTYYVKDSYKNGVEHLCSSHGTKSIGLLPFLTQITENNYTKGITSIGFVLDGGIFRVSVSEGGRIYDLPVGFETPLYTELNFGGEKYITGITGSFAADEDGNDVLKLRLSFIEIANTRLIKIFFRDGGIDVSFRERPGIDFVGYLIDSVFDSIHENKLISSIAARFDTEVLYYKIKNTIEPDFRCE